MPGERKSDSQSKGLGQSSELSLLQISTNGQLDFISKYVAKTISNSNGKNIDVAKKTLATYWRNCPTTKYLKTFPFDGGLVARSP